MFIAILHIILKLALVIIPLMLSIHLDLEISKIISSVLYPSLVLLI